jgi:Cu2+-exporting ATPase
MDNSGNNKHDHTEHHKKMIADFRTRFIVSVILTVPIIVLSPFIQGVFGFELTFAGRSYVQLALSSFVFFYGGWPFLKGFYKEMKDKRPGMMTLITLAIIVAYGYSGAVVLGLEGKVFFWELVTLIDVMLLGHWIEMRSVLSASKALQELQKLLPDEAHLKKDGEVKKVKISELKKGDIVVIKPGEKIPADGVVKDGETSVNEAMLTGESKPVEKKEGDEVIGGSINKSGSIEVELKNVGEDTYLSKVVDLVREAQESKSKTQRLADKAAMWLTIIAISVGAVTLVSWLLIQSELAFAIERTATVMVITCPHALGLAIPLVVAVSTSLSAKNGLLIRNRTPFEQSRKIDTVLFDKTGTLTEGVFKVDKVKSFTDELREEEVLKYAYSVEQKSEHPIAEAIEEKAKKEETGKFNVSDFEAIKGKGVKGKVNDKNVHVVSYNFLKENDIDLPEESEEEKGAYTQAFLLIDNKPSGYIRLADKIKESSKKAVKKLKEEGIECWMITGDKKSVAKEVSEELELDGYFAEVLPDEKQDKVKELQGDDKFVAVVGDGINDAPALAQADVGIAIGSGTDVAAETADIILVNNDPEDVSTLIKFGKETHKKMVQNLFWATGYNAVAIPLAAGVLYKWGIIISPAVGALLMSASTVIVAINAKLLKVEKEDNS